MFFVNRMNGCALHHIEKFVAFRQALQAPVRREHVQPLGKQQIDLRIIIFERRVAAFIPRHVVSGADPFPHVQLNLRRRHLGVPMGAGSPRLALPLF